MGLLSGYVDLPQWPMEGGLLARLIALQQQQGQYQQGAGLDETPSPPAVEPAMSWPRPINKEHYSNGQWVNALASEAQG